MSTRPNGCLVMGKNCVREVFVHAPERIIEIFVSSKKDPFVSQLLSSGIKINEVSDQALSSWVSSDSHQGIIAHLTDRPFYELKSFLEDVREAPNAKILALDGVTDPQNVGSILRAAECFGVTAVVWSKNRGPAITPVVSKASVGASELLPIVLVSNLVDALKKLKNEGFWVIGADGSQDAQSLNEFEPSDKMVVVFGAEGDGLSHLVRQTCDVLVKIPLYGNIESLNVSQAVSVFLFAIAGRQKI